MATSKSAIKGPGETLIAGRRTIDDWRAFQARLIPGRDAALWQKAFADYFKARLSSRYLDPIATLQNSGARRGEGFSIVAVQCSLIEFLESTVQGISYRYVPRRKGAAQPGRYEYSNSSDVFVSFLTKRPPFSADFTPATARDFYEGVRCGLLHEARTKNGWRISARKAGSQTIDAGQKVLYRDNFQTALLAFVKWYEVALLSDIALQESFIRQFNSLCA